MIQQISILSPTVTNNDGNTDTHYANIFSVVESVSIVDQPYSAASDTRRTARRPLRLRAPPRIEAQMLASLA